jgi:hypothetical protein
VGGHGGGEDRDWRWREMEGRKYSVMNSRPDPPAMAMCDPVLPPVPSIRFKGVAA